MTDTLRLVMPQWQGGNNPPYSFGAKLLAWLAPEAGGTPQVEVPIQPYTGKPLQLENGVAGRAALLQQLEAASKIIEAHAPGRLVVFGGDCLVAQAPFAYLNEKYGGRLGVLWLDAHPDISTPAMHHHEHAMVLGNLLGHGDPAFAARVNKPLLPQLVMYGGLAKMAPEEEAVVKELGLAWAGPGQLAETSEPLLRWIAQNDIRHLAIHLDLDVLNPALFRSLLFAQPGAPPPDAAAGEMTLAQVARVIRDVGAKTDVVGLVISEHLPWDALHLHNFLAGLPILGGAEEGAQPQEGPL